MIFAAFAGKVSVRTQRYRLDAADLELGPTGASVRGAPGRGVPLAELVGPDGIEVTETWDSSGIKAWASSCHAALVRVDYTSTPGQYDLAEALKTAPLVGGDSKEGSGSPAIDRRDLPVVPGGRQALGRPLRDGKIGDSRFRHAVAATTETTRA